jgi:SHS2 domain-containing protein
MSVAYLSHTADVRMLIYDRTLQGLFEQGVKGMSNILKESFCDEPHKFDIKRIVELESSDITNLLIDFLSDVLSSSYIEKVVYCHIEIIEFSGLKIKAELYGTHVKAFDEEIKAVTYHEADVKINDNALWETCIIFDI